PRIEAMIRTQIRAILRAAAEKGAKIKILVPMVSCVEEMRDARALIQRAAEELKAAGQAADIPPIGAMVEVPSAALMIDSLAGEVDFFSIGTNDLSQYALAADRGNAGVATLYHWSHPAFIRLLRMISASSRAAGK